MTSVNTNAAAITALRTLQSTNNQLDSTQARISTGLKIGEAKDNAAYWAISTTLKSDNKSLSTVKDALGLGAATVDVAYQGLNKAKDVLDEIKAKLTAATQDGVDKAKVQSEITELQKQLKSIAGSSSFSGENLLSVDSSAANYSSLKTIVSSFTRATNGSVSLGTIGVESSTMKLYDASAGADGILDTRSAMVNATGGSLTYGGLAPTNASGNSSANGLENKSAVAGAATISSPGTPVVSTTTLTNGTGGNNLKFDVTIDGVKKSVTLDATTNAGNVSDRANIKAALSAGLIAAGFTTNDFAIADAASGGGYTIASKKTGAGSGIVIGATSVTGTVNNGSTLIPAASGTQAAASFTVAADSASTTLDSDDVITFNVAVDGGDAKTVRIDAALVNATLGVSTGTIADIDKMVSVTQAALAKAGVTGVTVGKVTNALTFTSATTTGTSQISVSNVAAAAGASVMSVGDIDITKLTAFGAVTGAQQKEVLSAYISIVNEAINKVTTAAATLGSVASRIDMQKNFVNTLMDTIEKGVGGLIDADMSEESTKLQALQVKQQLGVQALSIANQSAQNVLSLFRA